MKTTRRAIPAVEKVLQTLGETNLPRPVVVTLVRRALAQVRSEGVVPSLEEIVVQIRDRIADLQRSRLQPVINGTGIIIHTNFGRAPLGAAAIRAVAAVGSSYNNLEYDLAAGTRGKRGGYLEHALALLCESEAATVVNNCAAALVLLVQHFTKKKPEVIISRGELVQIGGGFRIGEILETSGVRLREVGATNKTTTEDYARAVGPETAMILRVHQSNFFMSGFTAAPPNEAIAMIAKSRRVPFVVDLGSGALAATEKLGLAEHEPTPAEALKDGADLVCFSGDKLLGGPQAGIIAGKARLIAALKREPLFRALRCDKLAFAALQTVAEAHLRGAWEDIPVLALLRTPLAELRARAEEIVRRKAGPRGSIRIVETVAEIGGGALPRSRIPSVALEISSPQCLPNELAISLRRGTPPLVGYIARGKFRLDLRTVFPAQDEALISALSDLTSAVIPSEAGGEVEGSR